MKSDDCPIRLRSGQALAIVIFPALTNLIKVTYNPVSSDFYAMSRANRGLLEKGQLWNES